MRCPWCKNVKCLERLGKLGNLNHYRCRRCGGLSHKPSKAKTGR